MTDYQEKLREWARLTGERTPAVPEMPSEDERWLRCLLLLEECLEAIKASGFDVVSRGVVLRPEGCRVVANRYMPPSLTAMAHENADVLYIVMGTAVLMGVDMSAVFEEVHAANMRKATGGTLLKRADGKILKPDGWKPADVGAVLARLARETTP